MLTKSIHVELNDHHDDNVRTTATVQVRNEKNSKTEKVCFKVKVTQPFEKQTIPRETKIS